MSESTDPRVEHIERVLRGALQTHEAVIAGLDALASLAREVQLTRAELENVSLRLGNLTRPPFSEYTHAVAELRDQVRATLAEPKGG